MQQRPISDSLAGGRIRRIEQGLNLGIVKVGDQSSIGNLEGDREHSANLVECGRFAMLQKAEEGSDCSQSDVAGLR